MKTIERTEYLQWLERWKDKQIIKVVSGVRRCGKSTLFEIYELEIKTKSSIRTSFLVIFVENDIIIIVILYDKKQNMGYK